MRSNWPISSRNAEVSELNDFRLKCTSIRRVPKEERLIDSCSYHEIIAFRHGKKFTREPPRICTRIFDQNLYSFEVPDELGKLVSKLRVRMHKCAFLIIKKPILKNL